MNSARKRNHSMGDWAQSKSSPRDLLVHFHHQSVVGAESCLSVLQNITAGESLPPAGTRGIHGVHTPCFALLLVR